MALVVVVALLAAAGAGKLARMDGATYLAALSRAAATFAESLTLVAAVASALNTILRRRAQGFGAAQRHDRGAGK